MKIVLVAGGTGGHLFPSFALARALRDQSHNVSLFTDERAARWVDPSLFDEIVFSKFGSSTSILKKLAFWRRLLLCGLRSLASFISHRPDVVIGFGGYPSAPPVLAAQLLRIKAVLHESNAVMGRANKLLTKMARYVATGFEEVKGLTAKQVVVGNPVRPEIQALFYEKYTLPQDGELFHILILGGSQGSRIFSDIVPSALENLSETLKQKIFVHQQVRPEFLDSVTQFYQRIRIKFEVCSFFRNVDELLKQAHLVISRGGASSLSEIMMAGKPALIVPLAKTLDGDQMANALFYQKRHAIYMMAESEFTVSNFSNFLQTCLQNPKSLISVSQTAHQYAHIDAAEKLAKLVTNL